LTAAHSGGQGLVSQRIDASHDALRGVEEGLQGGSGKQGPVQAGEP
jgi:hypothetical protein